MVVTATGAVTNVIEYDGSSLFTLPAGVELIEATADAETGGTWNGSAFVRPSAVDDSLTRTEVLMFEVKRTADDSGDDKTADEIAAEKLELKNLLTAALVGGADLSQVETQTLLRLERE